MQPNYDAALDFLGKWCPGGPWVLTAVPANKERLPTQTFRDPDLVRRWLEKFGVDHNIYFHVNPTRTDISKKAEREDIEALAWLHVDIDPRPGEDIETEQARALKLLQNPPGELPAPTAIIFSGGGYQGFWRLKEAFPIGGKISAYEEAKLYNIQLERIFGADHCHNVDRIMRLPGTINRPDAKKRKKGRVEKLAELVEWHDDRTYALSLFTKANIVQSPDYGIGGRPRIEVSGNIARISDVNEDLPDKVSDLCKMVIVQGDDPDDPTRFDSRSEALFFVCCELVRAGVENDVIFSVITDPDFRISESVLDKGTGSERYAIRQIERAHEDAVDPNLRQMNEKHAVIGDIGGKCRVISEVPDHAMGRTRISFQSFQDIQNRYCHVKVEVGQDKNDNPVYMPLGKFWIGHPMRRQYETIVFAPGREVDNAYNLWRGFGCEARPGDCSRYLDHLRENICCGNQEHFEYLIGWMARAVQQPDSPGYTAVVLRGKQGTGKGMFAKTFGQLFGRHYLQVSDPKHVVGSFNAHLRDCSVLFADEAFYAGDKKHTSILKTLVTEEMIAIEAKGVDMIASNNYVHLIMASNETWLVPAGLEERRFFVLDVSRDRMQDTEYFAELQQELDEGGLEALLYHLQTYDLEGFNVRKVPNTRALQEQKILSFTPEQEWWFNKLRDGRQLETSAGWATEVQTNELLYDYLVYVKEFGISRKGNASRLGRFMQEACPAILEKFQKREPITVRGMDGSDVKIERPYYYAFPSLKLCRAHWDEEFGGPYDWPEVDVEEEIEAEVF